MRNILSFNFEFSAIVLFLFIFFSVTLILIIAFWNKKLQLQTVLFLLLLFQAGVWAAAQAAAFLYTEPHHILLIVKLSMASAIFVPAVFLHFVILYTGFTMRQFNSILTLLYIIPIMFFPFSFTEHSVVDFIGTDRSYQNVRLGVLYHFFIPYFLIYTLSALILLLKDLKNTHHFTRKKLQTYFLMIGFIIPAIFALLNNAVLPTWFGVFTSPNIGVYGMIVFLAAVFYSVIRLRFLDVRVAVSKQYFYSVFIFLYAGVLFGMLVSIWAAARNLDSSLLFLTLVSVLVGGIILFLLARDKVIQFIDRYYFVDQIDFSKYLPDGDLQVNASHELESFVMRYSGVIQEVVEGSVIAFYVLQKQHNNYTDYFLKSGEKIPRERVGDLVSPRIIVLYEDAVSLYDEDSFLVKMMRNRNAKMLVTFTNAEQEVVGFVLVGPHKNGIPYAAPHVQKLTTAVESLNEVLILLLNWQLGLEAVKYKVSQE